MTKRIIDGMSADQILYGWDPSQGDMLGYLESICKPEPTWSDDASKDTPILCWVSNEPIAKSGLYEKVDHVTEISEEGYAGLENCWEYARPISPDECWKPTQRGE